MALASLVIGVPRLWAADRWVGVQSEHFLLVGNASEGRIKSIARDLEQFRAAFIMLMPGIGKRLTVGTTVVVFKNDEAFTPYKPHYRGEPASVSGYFQPGLDANFIALNGEIQTPSVIYHEYAHRLIQDATSRLPPWANEGLAEFYSTFRASANGNSFELGRPIDHHLLLLRQQSSLVPLETLLAVQRDSPYYNETSKQGIFYAESWALIHYFMAGNNGTRRTQLSRYLELVAGGTSIDDSFRAAFQADYAAIEQELREYLHQYTMTYFKATLSTKLEIEKTLRTSKVADARAAAYLGELLVRMGRHDAAEDELRKAIALDPKTAAAYKSLGLLRLRQKSHEDALELLTKAVDVDEADYLTHFYLAQLLDQLAGDERGEQRRARLERIRTHVHRSIELAPHFVEAYATLAYVALTLRDGLEAAEQALIRATDEAPGREDLRLMLAEVMMANGKDLAARAVVSAVRAIATDPDIRRHADALQVDLQSRIASAQALREYQSRRESATRQPGAPRETRRSESVHATASADALPSSVGPARGSSAALRPTAPSVALRVEGVLVNIECQDGITLELRTERGPVRLHSDTPDAIRFVTFVAIASPSIGCGPLQPEAHVSVVYHLTDSPEWLGEPTVVEFRPAP